MRSARAAALGVTVGFVSIAAAVVVSCGGSGGTGGGMDGGLPDGKPGDVTVRDGAKRDAVGQKDGAPHDGSPRDATGGDVVVVDAGGDVTPCVPGCPPGVTCGDWTDCTGAILACGSPCKSAEVCIGTGTSPPAQSCQPVACTGKCGTIGLDACGVAIDCGGCPKGDACIKNACVPATPAEGGTDACAPPTCSPGGSTLCGHVANACGDTIDCSCPTGMDCLGGVCKPPPPECVGKDAGTPCGSVENACGSGKVDCGGCSGATKCTGGLCVSCKPPTCGGAICGSVSNSCGPEVSCGSCMGSEVCDDGGCCTPKSCGALVDAGRVQGCIPVDLGCGEMHSCLPCMTGYSCDKDGGACIKCTPKTCSDFSGMGCNLDDGCNGRLDCCGSGTACQQGICCAPGQVNFQGTCCQPSCNSALPVGPQVSCGVTLYCSD